MLYKLKSGLEMVIAPAISIQRQSLVDNERIFSIRTLILNVDFRDQIWLVPTVRSCSLYPSCTLFLHFLEINSFTIFFPAEDGSTGAARGGRTRGGGRGGRYNGGRRF